MLWNASKWSASIFGTDPYLNTDAGTMSPFEHGEVFVLDDGGEADLDLGNYERFLDVTLKRDNNMTTGKVYQVRSKAFAHLRARAAFQQCYHVTFVQHTEG